VDLYVVRHGIAFDQDPSQWPDDRLRPLTPEGEDRFRGVARALARITDGVDVTLASPYVRAWRTAEILAEEAGWPAPVGCQQLEADRPPEQVIDVLRSHTRRSAIAVVGHEPHLGELISILLTGGSDVAVVMKKGGVALLGFDGTPSAGAAELRWLLPPKLLRALRR